MSGAKHSPGPWEAHGGGGTGTRWNIYAWYVPPRGSVTPAGRLLVAQVNVAATGAEREANARLIAAAPDLLAALKRLRRQVSLTPSGMLAGISGRDDERTIADVDAAVAKAEGGAP
jgi:hypothetical protein